MKEVYFHKYQALENDFLVIDVTPTRGYATYRQESEGLRINRRQVKVSRLGRAQRVVYGKRVKELRAMGGYPERNAVPEKGRAQFVRQICDRHKGIGADGVIFFELKKSGFHMRIFNADGSEAEVSGNGLRILAQYIYQRNLASAKSFTIESIDRSNEVTILSSRGAGLVSTISLAIPQFELKQIPMRGRTRYFINKPFKTASGNLIGTAVNVGNPHIVFFVDNFDFDWQSFGREVEGDRRFPDHTNVEFAVIRSRKQIDHCSWERGVGITKASGTGASSSVAVGIINGYLDHKVTVNEPAGKLLIEIRSLNEDILLTGPSVKVGEGIFVCDINEKNTR